ncbi:KNR4/SMI1 homolog [Nicotiana tomentosiformis]|uniref:KNR4/SMI1 homolog n=1 Tax=Nicotiana tomentosiformis TaxID=4098 RepID=UPI00388C473D
MKILKKHGLDSGSEANILISQLQQKLEMIGQLREEVDIIKAATLGWKEGMDHLTAEKEAARAQLSSAESLLQGIKERSSVQSRKIEELEARLAFELAKAKSKAEKAKAEADAFVAVYRADAEATQAKEFEADARALTSAADDDDDDDDDDDENESGETLKEIHARGFDLIEEIKKAKELEADARALASDDDDDDDENESRSKSGEELDGEETTPGDNLGP